MALGVRVGFRGPFHIAGVFLRSLVTYSHVLGVVSMTGLVSMG